MIATPEFQVWLELRLHPEQILVEKRVGGQWVRY